MTLALLAAAGVLFAASGVPGLLLPARSAWGPRAATLATLIAAGLGLAGALQALAGGAPPRGLALDTGAPGLRLADLFAGL